MREDNFKKSPSYSITIILNCNPCNAEAEEVMQLEQGHSPGRCLQGVGDYTGGCLKKIRMHKDKNKIIKKYSKNTGMLVIFKKNKKFKGVSLKRGK